MTMSVLARPRETMAPDRATVHVIDDDVSPREALSLLSVGLDVRTYASVQEFLDAGAHDGSGCILLDVRLPGISGLDFQSRRAGFGVHLRIVLMTGHGDVPMSVRAMKAGAVDFLPKPFRDQDMIDAVTVAIERDRKRPRRRPANESDELAPPHGGYPRPTDHGLGIAGLEWISGRASQQKAVPLVRDGSLASKAAEAVGPCTSVAPRKS
jgi:ActR/RegA family two-component response regulator